MSEWTIDSVLNIALTRTDAGAQAIADAHNAAVAAEREESKRQHEGWVRADKATTIIYHENEKLKQQLAAERDKLKLMSNMYKVCCEQRDAERESGVKALAERSFELHECQKQLAAEQRKQHHAANAIAALDEQVQTLVDALDEIATRGADALDGYEAANIANAALAKVEDQKVSS